MVKAEIMTELLHLCLTKMPGSKYSVREKSEIFKQGEIYVNFKRRTSESWLRRPGYF